MSTPTPVTTSQPSSASKKPTGHVSTPSHLGASPAPRSVPSPAATRRDHAGKTPVNHPTASSQGSKTLGSTPMVPNLSQTGMTVSSSPGGQNASFGTPSALAGLGVDLGSATPGQLNMATPFVGGASMIPTMSDLGFSASGGKRNEDEERRIKMRKVLKSIGRPKGRVSEEAIARLSRRLGFQNDIDDDDLSAAKRARLIGNRDIAIAGTKVSVEVQMKEQRVRDVKASIYPAEIGGATLPPPMDEQSQPASKVLSRNLTVPSGILLESSLDRFAVSLDALAKVDRISTSGGVNCFEALNGLYKSLQRLHEVEKAATKREQEDSTNGSRADRKAERAVLCKRSGKATFNDKEKIGFAIQYWTTNLDVNTKGDDAMEVDQESELQTSSDDEANNFCLRVGVEECPASLYPPLRISEAWTPESPEDVLVQGAAIAWQEPPPTYLPESANTQGGGMVIDGAQRSPDIRFVATLDPPITMPYNTILNILSSVGVQEAPQVLVPVQYHALLLDIAVQTVNSGAAIGAKQSVVSYHESKKFQVTHNYSLDVLKPEYGYKLEEIPFSHPKQLIDLLPTLRQWAQFGTLLKDALEIATSKPDVDRVIDGMNGIHLNGDAKAADSNKPVSLEDLLKPPSHEFLKDVQVSIGIATSPQPTLALTFPNAAGTSVCSVLAQVGANAEVFVSHFDGFEKHADDDHEAKVAFAKKIAKALDIAGDLGVWVEWLRGQ